MTTPLQADILKQGANLRHILEHLYGDAYTHLRRAAALLQNDRPIVFIGMGSAAYVNVPTEFYLGRHGRLAGVLNASDALYSLRPALRQANIVLSSRSGETVEVVKLAQALSAESIPFLAVTNEPRSTLMPYPRNSPPPDAGVQTGRATRDSPWHYPLFAPGDHNGDALVESSRRHSLTAVGSLPGAAPAATRRNPHSTSFPPA